MAEVVDSIVANLEVRYAQYVDGFDKATAAHGKFKKSVDALKTQTFDLQAEGQKYRQGANTIANAEEQAVEKIKRVRRTKTAEAKRNDEAEVASAKAAAKAKADAEIREAERSARYRAIADRAAARSAPLPAAVGGRIGAIVPREATGQRGIPTALLNGTSATAVAAGETSAAEKINHLALDRFDLEQRIKGATGATKRELADQIDYLRRIETYKRRGLEEDQAILRAEKEMVAVGAARAAQERRRTEGNVSKFARGAGVSSVGLGPAAVGGLATAVGVGIGVEVIQSAVEYGKALDNLSKQLGISVEDLQAYNKLARDTGVETATLSSAFGQFASNLGRAQQGQEEYSKVFKALGVDIRNFKSAGDALPTVIDRISQLKDPLARAAIETRLFGEEGRKLDPLLSGGAARVSQLAASLQETGRALSSKEIQELEQTARKLAEVKNQLQVDFARIVAGNADAIIGLANSFAALSDKIVGAIGKLQQFSAAQILAGNLPGDPVAARKFKLASEGGRSELYGANTAAIRRNQEAFRILPADERLLAAQPPGSPRKTVAQLKREQLAAANAPLLNERREIVGAARAAVAARTATAPVQTGAVNQGLIGSLGAPKPTSGPKGKTAEQMQRDDEQRTRQFNDQIATATADFLRAQQDMTASVERRAEIEAQLVESAYKAQVADIDSQRKRNVLAGADAKLEAARATELIAAETKARDANLAAIEQNKRLDKERALTAATQSLLDAQAGVLQVQIGLATTNKERRRLSLELLDNQQSQEGNRLAGIINSAKPGDPAAQQALVDFGRLQPQFDAQRQAVLQGTASPLEDYRRQLHEATDDTNEALENVAVNGLRALEDQIAGSIGKVLGLKGAFGDLVGSVLADLAKIELKKGILSLLGGEGGGGGFFGSIGSLLSKLPRFAGGGSMLVGGTPGTDRNLLSINGEPRAMVGAHEVLNVVNPTLANTSRVRSSSPSAVTVLAPQHFDLTGVLMTEPVLRQMEQRNQQYANQVAAAAGRRAVNAAPARMQQLSTLGT